MSFKKRFLMLCLACIGILMCSISCMAATSDCTLTVKLFDSNKVAVDGIQISICKVADISGTDYIPTEAFADSGISIAGLVNYPTAEAANTVYQYVRKHQVESQSAYTQKGEAVFESLGRAIWLVYCMEEQSYSFNPYLVFLPQAVSGKVQYEVVSEPKLEEVVTGQKSIYVIKQWVDSENARGLRPESITVHLKKDNQIITSAKLSNKNGWSYTFTELSCQGNYSVEEEPVEHYAVKYNGDSQQGFVITNTYQSANRLPQTGQLWWPILMIAIAGACLVTLGIMELRNKRDEKE